MGVARSGTSFLRSLCSEWLGLWLVTGVIGVLDSIIHKALV